MKFIFRTTVAFLICFNAFANETIKNDVETTPAKACLGCHNKMVNLNGRSVEAIVNQTNAIKTSNKKHPDAGIKQLSDEEIAKIAAFLNEN
jgi:cytochrome c553